MSIILSKRLMAIAQMVTPGSVPADIGTDHGYIPIYLVQEGIAGRALAMDVRPGPLDRAREHVRMCGLEDQIELRLSDGIQMLRPDEADTLIIAGMGGALTRRILEEGTSSGKMDGIREMVLGPQSELPKVRGWLWENDFRIVDEDMVVEDGKYYPIIKAVRGTGAQEIGAIGEGKFPGDSEPVETRRAERILENGEEEEARDKKTPGDSEPVETRNERISGNEKIPENGEEEEARDEKTPGDSEAVETREEIISGNDGIVRNEDGKTSGEGEPARSGEEKISGNREPVIGSNSREPGPYKSKPKLNEAELPGVSHECALLYGPVLLRDRHPVLIRYLEREAVICRKIRGQICSEGAAAGNEKRLAELEERMRLIEEAFTVMQVQME